VPEGKGYIALKLEGGYGGVEETLWKATGRLKRRGLLDPRRAEASLRLQARRFSLDKLRPVISTQVVPNPAAAQLSVDLDLRLAGGTFTFSGRAALSGLTVVQPMLARAPVEDIGFEASLKGRYLVKQDLLQVSQLQLTRRRLRVRGSLEVLRLRTKPRIKLTVTVPRTRCAAVLDAIPKGLAPHLSRMRVAGHFGMRLTAEADFKYLTINSVDLDGSVDARDCKVLSLPYNLSAERLRGPFGHEFMDAGQKIGFEVGPDNPDFTPLDQISPHLQKAILTTEDSRFFYHRGFIPREFRTALARNLIARRFVFGASSITMQMVKNVLLGRVKTISRKLQEMVLTWYLERHLPKRRIFEIYLNVIEFGPGIYGIGHASRHLFGKPPAALEPQEAAYLASILPRPKRHYRKYCRQEVSRYWRRVVNRILRIMHKRRRLNDSELELALMSPIRFSDKEWVNVPACMSRLDRFLNPPR
jgi:hypothetical protein